MRFHGVMKESDDLDHVVICHAIEHDMARALDRSMSGFRLLARIDEVIAAEAWCKLIAVMAANEIRLVGQRLQRCKDQRLVALAGLVAELGMGESEYVDNVGARGVGNPISRHPQCFSRAGRVASWLKPSR